MIRITDEPNEKCESCVNMQKVLLTRHTGKTAETMMYSMCSKGAPRYVDGGEAFRCRQYTHKEGK